MTKAMEQEKADDRIFQFLTTELGAGHYHTKTTLEDFDLGLTRAETRKAVGRLFTSHRVEVRDAPADKKPGRGGAYTYLHPVASPPRYGDHRS